MTNKISSQSNKNSRESADKNRDFQDFLESELKK